MSGKSEKRVVEEAGKLRRRLEREIEEALDRIEALETMHRVKDTAFVGAVHERNRLRRKLDAERKKIKSLEEQLEGTQAAGKGKPMVPEAWLETAQRTIEKLRGELDARKDAAGEEVQ